jgi:uncharacterized membrane protein YbhN (UPF0104 family)
MFLRSGVIYTSVRRLGYEIKYMRMVLFKYAAHFMRTFIPFGAIGGLPFSAYLLYKNTKIPADEGLAVLITSSILRLIVSYLLVWLGFLFFMTYNQIPNSVLLMVLSSTAIGIFLFLGFFILWKEEEWLDYIAVFLGDIVASLFTKTCATQSI